MECPRCQAIDRAVPSYREAPGAARGLPLARADHPSGQTVHACASCGGVFVERAALIAIERWARDHGRRASAAEVALRAFAPERPDVDCPRCGVGMFARRWGMATLVTVDSCVECGGLWLDADELAQIEARSL